MQSERAVVFLRIIAPLLKRLPRHILDLLKDILPGFRVAPHSPSPAGPRRSCYLMICAGAD